MTVGPKGGAHGRRRLSKEELSLWLQVTRSITPRPGMQPPETPSPQCTETPSPKPRGDDASRLEDGSTKRSKGAYRPQALPLAPIERRLRQRLSRGQISIDMRIDLHGMRQDEAHSALRNFLSRARQSEAKVVLVVTGKGANKCRNETAFGSEGGVLRRTVPHWLSAPELRQLVLGFEEAAPIHGGGGALYVRLRSKRPSGGSHT
jgi:DNA-nicking Smr family endonuclease